MQRISSWTDLVTALGRFPYGTIVGGVSPTPIKAEWLNAVQEELCNLILGYLPAFGCRGQHPGAQGYSGSHR